jgi:hypothetical protein
VDCNIAWLLYELRVMIISSDLLANFSDHCYHSDIRITCGCAANMWYLSMTTFPSNNRSYFSF